MTTSPNPVLFERLTADNAALLLIDMQTGLLLGVTTSAAITLKNNILGLAQVGKTFGLPTLLTTSAATGPNGPYLPEVVAMFPGQPVQNRTLVNAWDDPAFVAAVEKTGRKKLIIAGITTDVCVLFPALAAVAAGYDRVRRGGCLGQLQPANRAGGDAAHDAGRGEGNRLDFRGRRAATRLEPAHRPRGG